MTTLCQVILITDCNYHSSKLLLVTIKLVQYIQTDNDKVLVERVEEATGRAFSQCESTFSANQNWQQNIGDNIVTWIRLHGT